MLATVTLVYVYVELIMSAGFVLEEVLEEVEGASLASDISGAGGMSGTFLKHHGGPMAERQLEFTLSRLVLVDSSHACILLYITITMHGMECKYGHVALLCMLCCAVPNSGAAK